MVFLMGDEVAEIWPYKQSDCKFVTKNGENGEFVDELAENAGFEQSDCKFVI